MTQPREELLAAARAMFGQKDLESVLAALDAYGAESHEPEADRVRLAILQLSEGKKEQLLYWVGIAKVDYRDVLASRQLGPLSSEEGARWQAMAQDLIKGWGKK
jgi:hypothetical protein